MHSGLRPAATVEPWSSRLSVEAGRGDGACRRAISGHTAFPCGAAFPGRAAQAFESRDGNQMKLIGRTRDKDVGGNPAISTVSAVSAITPVSALSGFAEQVFGMARTLAAGVPTPAAVATFTAPTAAPALPGLAENLEGSARRGKRANGDFRRFAHASGAASTPGLPGKAAGAIFSVVVNQP